ncbi:MAG: hyaluronate lyase, partial [Verrucomicrobiota bacterium]
MSPFLTRMALVVAVISGTMAARGDEYDALRLKWRDTLTQGTNANPADPLYTAWIASVGSDAQRFWSTMTTAPGRTFLWSDKNRLASNSLDITTTYGRLRSMALGYSVRGSVVETNPALASALLGGLDWMYANYYNERVTNEYDNWFDWEIGTPLNLNDITVLMYSSLSASQLSNYMNAVNWFTPVPNLTGANEVWKASIVALRGAIVKSSSKLLAGRQALSDVFPYVNGGDGFYTDGSFVFHTLHPYNGGYGAELIGTMGPLKQWLAGSAWEVSDPAQTNLYRWIYDSFQPLVYRGARMQMVSGRYYTRNGDDHFAGHDVIASILRIAQYAPAADAAAFKSMVKAWVTDDAVRDFIATQPPPYNVWAQAVLNDATVVPRPELVAHYQFPHMDRVAHLRPGWGFAVAMSSSRIGNYESIRGENLRGWYTGEGMTYLYGSDLNQYADGFWQTIDPYRLPGTTVDTHSRTNSSGESYTSPNNWTGGASLLGLYGVSGMHLNAWNSTLSARKSWFMFDNEVVCLGAGISSTDNRIIETTIENRRLSGYGNNSFTVNGIIRPSNVGWAETLTNVSWTHLAGNIPGSDIGLFFPQSTRVNALREARGGSLYDLNTTYGSTNRLVRNFLTLWIDHGMNPSNGAYACVLLPGRSPEQVASYAASPEVIVIENTTRAQAVRESSLGITAVNFWRDGSNKVGGITVDKKASVIFRNDGTLLDLGVSDPTQTNAGILNLEIAVSTATVFSADPAISVVQMTPTLKLSINLAGSGGRTLSARFFSGPVQVVALSPVADAYVQNGDQTNVNFGTAVSLGVKASGATLARESYFRFDISTSPGLLFDAALRLVPNSAQDALYHAIARVPDNTWTEGGLTWNNKPPSDSEFARWLVQSPNIPALIPIRGLVDQAGSLDGKLSLRVYSTGTPPATNGGYISYASRENGSIANRPQLLLSLGRFPPSVTVSTPSPGALFDAPAEVLVGADAQDPDGTIVAVEFFSGTTKLARITTPPYRTVLSHLSAGAYNVNAVAIDNSGAMSTSAPVAFAVYLPEPQGRGTGLLGEYYTAQDLTGLALLRTDSTVNFNWSTSAPVAQLTADHFSVRWTGKLQARHAGTHLFHTVSDEGVRLWVDGRLLIDHWNAHTLDEDSGSIPLLPGRYYDIVMEHYEDTGDAAAQLYWTQPGVPREIIPQSQLYSANTGLRATYFSGTNLLTTLITRIDHTVNFSWTNSSPDPVLLPGPFSVRWTGKVRAKQGGVYSFSTLSDDGVRLWIGGQSLVNNWTVHPAVLNTSNITLATGQLYSVTLEYFDVGGDAAMVLMWTPPGEQQQVIPESNLTPFQN